MVNPMCVEGTPVEHYPELSLYVKREDLSCSGPPFSKTRGVYAHIKNRPENVIGVLDTSHSQGGWAVARACKEMGKTCYNFFPVRKADRDETLKASVMGTFGPKEMSRQQKAALDLGATLVALQAGRSAVLYHEAKKRMSQIKGPWYMMPNALKLPEMITETVAEVARTPLPPVDLVIVSASSGTIAAGVILGLQQKGYRGEVVVHQGYSRSAGSIRTYMEKMAAEYVHPRPLDESNWNWDYFLVDEGYAYGDAARKDMPVLPFPSNTFYDRKAVDWWLREGRARYDGREALLWNIG